jgi:hypothetical protein
VTVPDKRDLPDPVRLRKRLCLEIAEAIEHKFKLARLPAWDNDECAGLIDCYLPLSVGEAAAWTEWLTGGREDEDTEG